ncbi:MAG: tryptophan--tRNA ligase [Armatimonadetes bacterium]|nr:tryptophan--tRNA ligase [Armatimonadota bacterium]
MSTQKRILSGMRSTNPRLHIGNYEGALRPWLKLQEDHKMYCMVADWHALTELQDEPQDVRKNALEVAKDFVAAGIDPSRSSVFIQSDVKEHAELSLLLGMITGVGKLERNPTYKDKTSDVTSETMISYGLLGYPVLQSADILLYKPSGVPVGKDQAPHLELTREIARSFNAKFGDVFPEFVNVIDQDESRSKVPGLDMRKMSKSYDNCIYLSDTPEQTAKRIKSAFTTPSKIAKSDPGIPEGCSVCQYLKLYSPDWEKQWDEDRRGERGCSQSKNELTELINEYFRPMRERRAALSDDDILDILKKGSDEAREFAAATMDEVRRAMRLV